MGGDRKPLGLGKSFIFTLLMHRHLTKCLSNSQGLRSSNNFVGCLSEVYFNDVSILQKLRVNSPQALYHSIFRPEIGQCADVPVVPITFPFQESKLAISVQSVPPSDDKFYITFGFKTRNATAHLAYGTGLTADGSVGLWEVRTGSKTSFYLTFVIFFVLFTEFIHIFAVAITKGRIGISCLRRSS